jgi:hypothetical protein
MFRLNQLRAGTHFGGSSVRFRCGPPGCLPSVLTRPKWLGVHLAAWGFYVRASSPRVTPGTAGYDYGATWGPAPAGLAPASQAVSFAALPRRGPSGRFPRVTGSMRRSDSPPPVPPRFVAFTWRYPGCTRVSLPPPPGAATTGLELVTRYLRPGFTEEMAGPPRFLGDLRERAPFSDPGGTASARPLRRRDTAFRYGQHVGSRD